MAVTPVPQGPIGNHLNALLANLSIEYRPTNARFIVDDIFPVLSVQFWNDSYAVWDKGQRFRLDRTDGKDTLRQPGTRAKQFRAGWTNSTYTAQEYSGEAYIEDSEAANTDAALNLLQAQLAMVQDKILLDREVRVAATLTNTATYPTANTVTKSGVNQWNSASFASQSAVLVSQIKADIDAGKEAIRKATGGIMPNTIIIPEPVAQVVERDLGVADLLKHNGGITDLVSNGYPLADGNKFFGMRVLRPSGTYQSEVEGETATVVDIWGKDVILAYVGPAAQRTLTFGLQFRVKPFGALKQYREEAIDTTFYRYGTVQTEVVVVSNCGYQIHNAIA